jgi:transcription-repair coupling factor (superfamily II helicase)
MIYGEGREHPSGPFRCCPRDEVLMDLARLLALLKQHPPLERLITRLMQAQSPRMIVAPVPSAARPAVAALLTGELHRPALLLTGTLDAAARLREDLQVLLGDDAPIFLYPAADALWYEHMSVGDDVIGARLRVLQALHAARHSGACPEC